MSESSILCTLDQNIVLQGPITMFLPLGNSLFAFFKGYSFICSHLTKSKSKQTGRNKPVDLPTNKNVNIPIAH